MLLLLVIGFAGVLVLFGATREKFSARRAKGRTVRNVSESLKIIEADPAPVPAAVHGITARPPMEAPELAPLSAIECVWWRLQVFPRTSGLDFPIAETSYRTFVLHEDGRHIWIEPALAMTHGQVKVTDLIETHSSAFDVRSTPATDWARKRFPSVRELLVDLSPSRVEFTEWTVPEGVRATVTGWLAIDEDTGDPVLRAWETPEDERPAIIVSLGIDTGVRELHKRARTMYVVGAVFTAFGFGLYLSVLIMHII